MALIWRGGGSDAAKWLIVVLLAVIATCLLFEVGFAASAARGQTGQATGAGSGKGTFAVAGQVTPETYGLYLVDPANGTICVYQYLPGTRRLRLMAARTYIFDLQLDQYNTEPPPREIKKLVAQHKRLGGPATRP